MKTGARRKVTQEAGQASTIIIRRAIRHELDPKRRDGFRWDTPIGDYIRGGPGALGDFAAVLNKAPALAEYRLDLSPHHLTSVKLARELIGAVTDWLKAKGWEIVR